MADFPVVRITNHQLPAISSCIELDGRDISTWVSHYEVIGNIRDATILRLDILVGGLEITAPMTEELDLGPGAETLLIKHGWTPPVETGEPAE